MFSKTGSRKYSTVLPAHSFYKQTWFKTVSKAMPQQLS